jgi:RNA polymerase sigma-70 factor (sigma-E family)
MSAARDDEFTEYVAARLPWLGRVAYLLCQDRHRAEDLVQAAITRLYVHWRRASAADNLDGYMHTVLVRVYLSEQSTAWSRRVRLLPALPDDMAGMADLDADLDLRAALTLLAPRQRAAIVLRYYCDLSVDQTAAILGCSAGTVKSQTARGLDALRRLVISPTETPAEGMNRS